MKPQRKTIEDEGPKVPGYIVTFSDMVTLLLTFFVMLLTLADVQDPELFDKGRDSFLESLRYVGLGTLFGRQQMPQFGSIKNKYHVPNPDDTPTNRSIDAKTRELHRIFDELKKSMTTMTSGVSAQSTNFSVVNVHFSDGTAKLDNNAIRSLTEFCRDLQLSAGRKPGTLYVLGLAPDVKNEKQQWMLSANRAETVARFLRNNLNSASNPGNQSLTNPISKWSIYSWGGGSGGDWTGPDSMMSEHSQILIAVLK